VPLAVFWPNMILASRSTPAINTAARSVSLVDRWNNRIIGLLVQSVLKGVCQFFYEEILIQGKQLL
jgi:hypothetical protein